MIKYNNSNINDWDFGTSNIIKVYRNGAVCYYKITTSGGTSAQTPCYAVVDDISQYSDTEFEDVFNKANEKWYKLNNLNEYEQYGVYGSGRTITTYDGKLTIDDEITPSPSRLPSGYTEVEYIENTSMAYLNLDAIPYSSASNSFVVESKLSTQWADIGGDWEYLISTEQGNKSPYNGFSYRWDKYNKQLGLYFEVVPNNTASFVNVDNGDGTSSITISCDSTNATNTTPITLFCGLQGSTVWRNGRGKFYSFKLTINNTLVRDLVPCKRDSDNKYGMYDIVNDVFYLSPNGNNFSGGSEVIPPPITKTYEYQYSGGSWVNVGEVSGSTASLPNVPFTVNYNARNYNPNTKALLKTNGQLADVDAVINVGDPTVNDGYLTIASGTIAVISGYSTYFNRYANNPNLTIISKQKTVGDNCHMFANRNNNYNWMYRPYSDHLTLHGNSEQGGVAVTTQPVIESVRVDSSRNVTYNNYTNNTTSGASAFSYGSTNSGNFAIFAGYAGGANDEWFVGDFYWVYMSQSTLTDEQVQQVIAYNESNGSIYPVYYDVMQDPPNNLSFSSMTEAEEYECPYVGMKATIDGDSYVFSGDSISGYEWVYIPGFHGKWLATYTGGTTVSAECDSSSSIGYIYPSDYMTSIEIGDCVTEILEYVFSYYEYLTAVTIGSGITFIGGNAFADCPELTSITIKATTPPTLDWDVFYNTDNCLFYVPAESVSAYKTASGWSDYSSRITAIP